MAIGCALVIVATFIQTFAPQGNIGVFIAGRAIVGMGQGVALSKSHDRVFAFGTDKICSIGPNLYWRASSSRYKRQDYVVLANVLFRRRFVSSQAFVLHARH